MTAPAGAALNLTASVLVLASGLTHAIVNAIFKAGRDKLAGRALIDGFSALLVAPCALLVPLPEHAWGWLGASWALHAAYLYTLIRAFERADMTVAYPIARGLAPVVAATVASLVFHEPVTVAVALGIGLIACGVACIGTSHTVDRRAIAWAVATGTCIAGYTVVDAQGVRAAPSAASYVVWTFMTIGAGVASILAASRGRQFVVAAATQWRAGLAAGALSIVSYGLALNAFRIGATPRLAALRETSILFAAVIAVVFLGERLGRARLAGIVAIAIGAIVLVAGR